MDVCVTWKAEIRQVWNLQYTADRHLLPASFNDLPLFDVLCKRVMSDLHANVNSNCSIVSVTSFEFALLHCRMHCCTEGYDMN